MAAASPSATLRSHILRKTIKMKTIKFYYNMVHERMRVFSLHPPLSTLLVIFILLVSCSDDGYQSRLRELIIEDMTFECNKSSQELVFRHEDLTNYDCQSSEEWCEVAFDVVGCKLIPCLEPATEASCEHRLRGCNCRPKRCEHD